ncbi:MAG: hypothetical protein EPN84_12970 [Legionella sp.]|nr:MAG: hypothetical protein EPN84_12970 [Legionella sp.]
MPGQGAAKPFTLTMLGTDTVYTPALKQKNAPKDGDYPKGETLSLISTEIKTSAPPLISSNTPVAYTAPEIEVINGPTTLGTEVGDRIGRGVASILKAISRGQRPINIIAHSRGAVESILIAHEIEALQLLIKEATDLNSLIKALEDQQKARLANKTSNTPDIFAILKDQLKEQMTGKTQDKETFFTDLKNNFPEVSINLFAIDPVPGDVRPITWYDSRFYTVPRVVRNAEFLFYENERTDWGFTPLCPDPTKNAPEQRVRYLTIPGHHGTGSAGSNRSQTKKNVSPLGTKATDVQKLLLFKLLDFLGTHGVEFRELELFAEGRALGRRSALKNKEGKFDFPAIYRKLYSDLIKNRKAYQAYNQTSYAMMGVLKDDRRLFRRDGYTKFRNRFNLGTGYINDEHAQLMQEYFFKKLGLNNVEQNSLLAVVQSATRVLVSNIQSFQANPNPSLFASMMRSTLGTALPLLTEPNVRKDVINSFGVLVNRVSNKYLTSDWYSEEKIAEKKELFKAITQMISQLKALRDEDSNEVTQSFVASLLFKIASGIKTTVDQQNIRLKNEIDRLTADPLQSYINELVLKLKNVEDKSKNDATVASIFADPNYILLKDSPLESKMQFILSELVKALPEQSKDYSVERLLSEFNAYQEIYKDELVDFINLYEQIQIFIQDLDALGGLDPSLKPQYAVTERILLNNAQLLIPVAARRFYSNKAGISENTVMADNFQGQVERYAILHYGAKNPLVALKEASEQNANQLKNNYIANLNSREKAEHLLLIQNTLIPKTQIYHDELMLITDVDPDELVILERKKAYLKELLDILDKPEVDSSTRVEQFYTRLNFYELKLGEHRDARWKRYTKNVLFAGLTLITGILPGLLALLIYINMGETSGKSIWFWQSRGENIVNDLKQHQPLGLNIDPNKGPQI